MTTIIVPMIDFIYTIYILLFETLLIPVCSIEIAVFGMVILSFITSKTGLPRMMKKLISRIK